MTPETIALTLSDLFGLSVQTIAPGSYQIEAPEYRLLVLLSDDQSWVRVLIPIAPAQEAQPFLEQLLNANFDATQETRYALYQNVLWGVFQHSCVGLTPEDLTSAVKRLLVIQSQGLTDCFNQFVEERMRQIIQTAKRQGQSLETTLQTLDRFYQEGIMGDLGMGAASREEVLSAWQRRLESLWSEVEPE